MAVAVGDTGRLDYAVNSAGIDGGNIQYDTINYPNEIFDDMLNVNVRGMFFSMRHELARMVEQGHGSVVNIGSGAGVRQPRLHRLQRLQGSRSAADQVAAIDYAKQNIRVNVICPALVNTPAV